MNPSTSRKRRILWAAPVSLLDSTSGAAMSMREILRQLSAAGIEVAILGATIFDAPAGAAAIGAALATLDPAVTNISVSDGILQHELLRTASTVRRAMTAYEESLWLAAYMEKLASFRPDLIMLYGGLILENMITGEARHLGIPSVAYLVNGAYTGQRWHRDIALILTDSLATARFYRETQHIEVVPIGKFIDPASVVAPQHRRETLLFVNPCLEKGVLIVAALALLLEQRRPDIRFEVVEARGNWSAAVLAVSTALGTPRHSLDNVTVTPNCQDMRPIYGRARLLLAPSLWWESGPRVTGEAMMNGIPAIVTNRGGNPQWVQDAGLLLDLEPELYEAPYNKVPHPELLEQLASAIVQLYDDEERYQVLVARARRVGAAYDGSRNVRHLLSILEPLLARRAGDALA